MIGSFFITIISLIVYLIFASLAPAYAFLAPVATAMLWVTVALGAVCAVFIIAKIITAFRK